MNSGLPLHRVSVRHQPARRPDAQRASQHRSRRAVMNPLYSRSCPIGTGCQPYRQPVGVRASRARPVGQRAPHPGWRSRPVAEFVRLLLQKNFNLGESPSAAAVPRGRAQHAQSSDVRRGSEQWRRRRFHGRAQHRDLDHRRLTTPGPRSTISRADHHQRGAAIYNNIVNMVNAQTTASGALPANFFTMPLPANFYGTPANSYRHHHATRVQELSVAPGLQHQFRRPVQQQHAAVHSVWHQAVLVNPRAQRTLACRVETLPDARALRKLAGSSRRVSTRQKGAQCATNKKPIFLTASIRFDCETEYQSGDGPR